MQVMTNRRKDATAATWIYFDEIHVLLKDPMSSKFLYSSWKRFRKYNAYATGISQDIQDYLDNPVAYALLSNSEFVIMLRQSKSLEALERLYGLSKPQLEFLRCVESTWSIVDDGNTSLGSAIDAYKDGYNDLACAYLKSAARYYQTAHDSAAAFD